MLFCCCCLLLAVRSGLVSAVTCYLLVGAAAIFYAIVGAYAMGHVFILGNFLLSFLSPGFISALPRFGWCAVIDFSPLAHPMALAK